MVGPVFLMGALKKKGDKKQKCFTIRSIKKRKEPFEVLETSDLEGENCDPISVQLKLKVQQLNFEIITKRKQIHFFLTLI